MARLAVASTLSTLAAGIALANAVRLVVDGQEHRGVTWFVSCAVAAVLVGLVVYSTAALARERGAAVKRLRKALGRGMALRAALVLEDRGHWEGERLVMPDPVPFEEDPLFRWARESYDLLLEDFPAHADDFYGDDVSLGPDHFALPYTTEIKRGGREAYLERRIVILETR